MTRRMLARKIAPMLLEDSDNQQLVSQLGAYLVEQGRTGEVDLLINDIALEMERLGYSDVDVVSAHALSSSVRSELEQTIKQLTSVKSVKLNETVDQSLIGGIIATTPSLEIDLSVRRQLKALSAN